MSIALSHAKPNPQPFEYARLSSLTPNAKLTARGSAPAGPRAAWTPG